MKDEINYYYNVFPDKISHTKDHYYFYIGEIKYYLLLYTATIREFELILTIVNEYIKRGILIDEILLNVNSSYVSNINGNNYILVKVNENKDSKELLEINFFDCVLKTNKKEDLGYKDWDILWSKKVDDYEKRIVSLINKNKLISNTFDYYIGMSENAIAYVKNTLIEEKSDDLTIGHKRFNANINNVYNPFNLVIDYEARDIAEYIKNKFFNSTFSFNELENLINSKYFSPFIMRMIFARLLYPSYYFDILDEAFKGTDVTNDLNNIIKRIDSYEAFLLEVYEYFSEFNKLPKIDWLYRKKD